MDLGHQDHVNNLGDHRRSWRNNASTGLLDPVWPREPAIEVARKLAVAFLPADTFADAQISPFA